MTDKELLDQIDELLAEAKKSIYHRAGYLVGGGHINLRQTPSGDYSTAKALILTTIPRCFKPLSVEGGALVERLGKID